MNVQLVHPFPEIYLGTAWRWLLEYPDRNMDDYGPKTEAQFIKEMKARTDETIWGVKAESSLCGIISYLPLTQRLGTLHGVCFTKHTHGTGIPHSAMLMAIDQIFRTGCEKLCASIFADNERCYRFLNRLGFVVEGYLAKQTVRHGSAIDMKQLALFAPER